MWVTFIFSENSERKESDKSYKIQVSLVSKINYSLVEMSEL